MAALALTSVSVARLIRRICELEVQARKPGNVSFASPGHGMTAEMFVQSAASMAAPLCQQGVSLGERVYAAVLATRNAVGCNTNLGIILLVAPLVHAALRTSSVNSLRERVESVLSELRLEDAQYVFDAIRMAAPGGLGKVSRHDVSLPADVDLIEAMQAASSYDRIAWQYAHDYADVFDVLVPLVASTVAARITEEAAVAYVFLDILARWPDSHIARKFDLALAENIRQETVSLRNRLNNANAYSSHADDLVEFDISLKRRGINPGTSADLTVAAFSAFHIQQALDCLFLDPSALTGGLNPPRALACEFHQPV